MPDFSHHPCVSCGACCAFFRVSVPAQELNPLHIAVPLEQVQILSSGDAVMRGTDRVEQPRCEALQGTIGIQAPCSIYENRPSACRKFEASFEYGVVNPRCNEARAAWNLPPLKISDYDAFRNQTQTVIRSSH